MRNYYEILGVERDSTPKEIKSAYKKLALKYHPDKNQGDLKAEEKFKEITEAYSVLSNSEKRSQYDSGGYSHEGAHGFDDIFSHFSSFFDGRFHDIFSQGRTDGAEPGESIKIQVLLDFQDVLSGATKEVFFDRKIVCKPCVGKGFLDKKDTAVCEACQGTGTRSYQAGFMRVQSPCHSCDGKGFQIRKPCQSCSGSGWQVQKKTVNVSIPKGMSEGHQLRLDGMGCESNLRGPNGDVYIVIRIQAHPHLEKKGSDIHSKKILNFAQAVMGCNVEVPTVDGIVNLSIPKGTQSESVFRVHGKGLPTNITSDVRGDQYVKIIVEIPRETTEEELSHISELGKIWEKSLNSNT